MKLFFYNEFFDDRIEKYYLNAEQLRFTGLPKEAVELSKKDQQRHPILGIKEDKLVTFLVLYEKEGISPYFNDASTLILRNFSTDYNYLGEGYATKTLLLLPSYVKQHFPKVRKIMLGVNLENIIAQNLYLKNGFIDTGKQGIGESGELRLMNLTLFSENN